MLIEGIVIELGELFCATLSYLCASSASVTTSLSPRLGYIADNLRAMVAKSRVKSQPPSYSLWVLFDVIAIMESGNLALRSKVTGELGRMLTCHDNEPLQSWCSDSCDQVEWCC